MTACVLLQTLRQNLASFFAHLTSASLLNTYKESPNMNGKSFFVFLQHKGEGMKLDTDLAKATLAESLCVQQFLIIADLI